MQGIVWSEFAMDLIEIHLRRKIDHLVYRSSVAFFLERDQIIFYFWFDSFSGYHKSIIFDGKLKRLFFYSSQWQQNDDLLRRFIDIIWDTRHFLFLLHGNEL